MREREREGNENGRALTTKVRAYFTVNESALELYEDTHNIIIICK